MAPDPLTLTCWLNEWRDGDPDAANHLFAAAWPELSRLTAWHLREHPDHALRSDALLNELYGQLFAANPSPGRTGRTSSKLPPGNCVAS